MTPSSSRTAADHGRGSDLVVLAIDDDPNQVDEALGAVTTGRPQVQVTTP